MQKAARYSSCNGKERWMPIGSRKVGSAKKWRPQRNRAQSQTKPKKIDTIYFILTFIFMDILLKYIACINSNLIITLNNKFCKKKIYLRLIEDVV